MKEQRIGLLNLDTVGPENIEDYVFADGYSAFKKVLEMPPAEVIDIIEESGLRGRGGAGFPTGQKWKLAASRVSPVKYVICNADEGEPGTFKDRPIMEKNPHSFLEGLMIACYAVGAKKAYVYIRGEYSLSIKTVTLAIEQAVEENFLGENIFGSDFSLDVEIKLGAGSYLCGEEFTLIESLEGKRGYPRTKPPYPVEKGLFNKPTVINNVETLTHVPHIINNGVKWYRGFGTDKSPGTKIFTLSGDVKKKGYYEVEMGTSLEKLIFKFAGGISSGKKVKAVLIGGAAGAFFSGDDLDIPMDFESLATRGGMLGSGAVIVMNENESIVEMLHSILHFFQHESCGKCAPCRVGTTQLTILMEELMKNGSSETMQLMLHLAELMAKDSLCALGQSPLLPVRTAFKNFEQDFLK